MQDSTSPRTKPCDRRIPRWGHRSPYTATRPDWLRQSAISPAEIHAGYDCSRWQVRGNGDWHPRARRIGGSEALPKRFHGRSSDKGLKSLGFRTAGPRLHKRFTMARMMRAPCRIRKDVYTRKRPRRLRAGTSRPGRLRDVAALASELWTLAGCMFQPE